MVNPDGLTGHLVIIVEFPDGAVYGMGRWNFELFPHIRVLVYSQGVLGEVSQQAVNHIKDVLVSKAKTHLLLFIWSTCQIRKMEKWLTFPQVVRLGEPPVVHHDAFVIRLNLTG